MSTAKSRLAQAIAMAVSPDGRKVDRVRLAESLGVAGPDDPLVVMLEALCLAEEAKASLSDVIAHQSILLDQGLRVRVEELNSAIGRHAGELFAAERRLYTAQASLEADRVKYAFEIDARFQTLESIMRGLDGWGDHICATANAVRSTANGVRATLDSVILRQAVWLFVGGAISGAITACVLMRERGP